MKTYVWILAAAALLLGGGASLAAQEGVELNGYVRSKAGALVQDGSYFLTENTLDLRFSYDSGNAAFFANTVLYERDGAVEAPDLREVYVDLRGDAFDLRLGKQQIIWGKADGVFITDIVSPKDLSQFLVPDFEELRRAVTGVRLDLYAGAHGLELVWLPWFTPTIMPGADTIWAPALPFTITPTIEASSPPAFDLENGEYFLKYTFMGTSIDAALVGGWFWNDTPAYTVLSFTPAPPELTLRPDYYRVAAAGYSVSGPVGPLILRSEGVWYGGRRFQGSPAVFPDGYAEKNSLQYLAGADFSVAGFNFGLQYMQERILDYEDGLVEDDVQNTATLALSKTFLRETLTLELFSYVGFEAPDALIRAKLTWDFSDAVEIFAGAYIFLGDEGDFGQYGDNDGAYVGVKMSF